MIIIIIMDMYDATYLSKLLYVVLYIMTIMGNVIIIMIIMDIYDVLSY